MWSKWGWSRVAAYLAAGRGWPIWQKVDKKQIDRRGKGEEIMQNGLRKKWIDRRRGRVPEKKKKKKK
jgi:hypothetical protein